jgi:hypothetical protein
MLAHLVIIVGHWQTVTRDGASSGLCAKSISGENDGLKWMSVLNDDAQLS